MEAAAGLDLDASQLVPTPQLIEGDTKAICNGDQRIAPAHGVEPQVRRGRGGRRNRNDQGGDALQAVTRVELIGLGKRCGLNAIFPRHGGKRVVAATTAW